MKITKKVKELENLVFQFSKSQSILKDRILSNMESLIKRYKKNKKEKIKELKKEAKKENKLIKKELKKLKKEIISNLKTKDNSLNELKHNVNLMLNVQIKAQF